MCATLSIIVIFAVVAFLAGAVLGMFVLISISIHRTSLTSLSGASSERAGSISRRVLTVGRVTRKESDE